MCSSKCNIMRINTFAVTILVIHASTMARTNSRNIIFILADDLGWNDVGYHNINVKTQNIDRLARQGVIMNNSYVQYLCTPSRSALMTGVYPFRDGFQTGVFLNRESKCVPLHRTFLPEKLKELGYATHIVGKWHLGFCNLNCTPTFRGFDTFLGFYNSDVGYFSKRHEKYLDFRNNTDPLLDTKYSTTIFGERAVEIIENHDNANPLILYIPFQTPHCPLEAPDEFLNLYPPIKNKRRRIYSAMVTAMDKAIGAIINALKRKNIYKDTLIIFSSDNGGTPATGGNNYPLRGAKGTLFEGGTRAVGFFHGSGLHYYGNTYNGLFHIVDWYPTIYAAAGGNASDLADQTDDVNQWDAIRTGGMSPRNEIVYNVNDIFVEGFESGAIRVGDYKLITGYAGPMHEWYKPDNEYFTNVCDVNEVSPFIDNLISIDIRQNSFLVNAKMLFNIRVDPYERIDISNNYPAIVDALSERLYILNLQVPPTAPTNVSPYSDPNLYGGYWSPGWC